MGTAPFQGAKHEYAIDGDNPFYLRDMNKCIVCGRCTRACEEIVGRNVLDFSYRGFNTKVRVSSRRGFIEIPVNITETAPKGIVYTSFHFSEAPVNRLTNPKVDAVAKTPELKVCACKVEKIA